MGYYHSLDKLQDEFKQLIERTIKNRCKNQLAIDYLNRVMAQCMQHIDRKKNDFNAKLRNFYETKFKENGMMNPKVEWEWSKFAGAKRQYINIDDYKVVTDTNMGKLKNSLNPETVNVIDATNIESEEYQEVINKMKTTKKS